MEIIEIGAVIINQHTEIIDSYQGYIKPIIHPTLTKFCTDLTGIEQHQIDTAPLFPDAFAQFHAWLKTHAPLSWASWGQYDANQFTKECKRHHIHNHMNALPHHNIKPAFAKAEGIKPCGLNRAFVHLQEDMQGHHHCGLDDAINTARLAQLSPNFKRHIQENLFDVQA